MEEKAKRDPCGVRYDLITPSFVEGMAKILDGGAKRYGEKNWLSDRLDGEKGPVNHALKHINDYRLGKPNEKESSKTHLLHAAVNLMMEWTYSEQPDFIICPEGFLTE